MVSRASNIRREKSTKRGGKEVEFKRVAFHLTTSQIDGLKSQSDSDGEPFAEHIRRAVDGYLGKRKPRSK